VIGSLAQPLLFLVSFGFGFGSIYQKAGNGNYMEFLAPGIILMSVLFTALFSGIDVIWDRQFGFLKETLAAPVSRLSIMFGRTLGGATVASIQGIVVFFLTLLVGFRPGSLILVLAGFGIMFLVAVMFTSLGTWIASTMEDMQGFQLIMNFLVMPIFFLSGALFPTEEMPKFMLLIARINPLSYGVDAIRGTLIGVSTYGIHLDMVVLLLVTAVFLVCGSYSFSKIQV
jgi:ABC-2 type transport system permease protein